MTARVTTINAERFKTSVFFSLKLTRKFGNRARVTDGVKLAEYLVAKKAAEGATSNGAVEMDGACKATKQLIVSEAFNKLNEHMNGTKDYLVGKFGRANPSRIKEGLFTVAVGLVEEFEAYLAEASDKLANEFVPAFITDYPLAIERARNLPVKDGGLGPLFNLADYVDVSELIEAFSFEWQWLALSVPEGLPEGLKQAAQQKLEQQLSDAADEITQALRESFLDLIAHASDKLAPSAPGEKGKIFRDTLVGNIQAFLDTFQDRNVMNDEQLAGLVEKAKAILSGGLNAKKLRDFPTVRESARQQFDEIKSELDKLVVERPGRRFNLED